MIDKQKLLELVVALNAECDRQGPRPNDVNGVKAGYVLVIDRHGDLVVDKDGNPADSIAKLKDGVGIIRDTFDTWSLTIRPSSAHGLPMRYDNPVELVRAALAREHGPHAFYLDQGEVRRLRGR